MSIRQLALATILTAIAFGVPSVGETQQTSRMYRIGALVDGTTSVPQYYQAFVGTLREHGFVEGQNLAMELRFAAGRVERFPELVADLVRLKVDVIVSGAIPAIRAAKQATTTIPIVMVGVSDPVGNGLVASLAHPGGNVTGVAGDTGLEILGKMLEVMKEAVPTASRVAILSNVASNTSSRRSSVLETLETAAQKLGLTLRHFDAENRDDFDRLFSAMVRDRVNALLVRADPLVQANRTKIAELAERHRLPAIYGQASFLYDANGLMFYGHDVIALNKQAAGYASKILKGAKPADLLVEQPNRYELLINLKTATALGLTIPRSVLFRADRVIE